jgi:DNA-binding CsgD family transcriptional regulator/tetratricopeptide (TPR) repeat protein
MMLLERENVLTALWDHLALAARGQGRLVLLRGEAGAGKTAVLGRFAGRARSVADVLVGGCDPLTTPRPLGPLVDVAAGLGAAVQRELERANGGPGRMTEVLRCVMDALGSGRPKVLIFEDVHWADEATLDLICLLGRRIEHQAAVLVASYRDDEIGPSHRLRALLGDLAGVSAVHRCAIEPLSPHGVARLTTGRRVDTGELYRVTGGNPFFVTEVLAAEGDGIPATVAEAVAGRMGKVSPAAREAAEMVAVIGSRAPVKLVAALVDEAVDVIEELLGAGLLQTNMGGAVGFRHELARMAVLDAIPDFRRTALHAQVLDRLRADPARRDDHALLAHHAELAEDRDAVLAYAPPAAAHAAALGAHREAAAHYGRAVRFSSSLPPQRRATLLELLGRECVLASQLAEGINATQAALELRRALGDRLREGDNLRWLSFILWPAGRTTEAKQAGQQAVRVLETLPPSRALAWAYVNMCQLSAFNQYGVAVAEDFAQRAVVLSERFEDAEVVGQARFHLAATRFLCADDGSDDDGWERMDTARVGMLEAGLVEPAAFMVMMMGAFAALHRDNERAFPALDLLETHSLEYDMPGYLVFGRGARALGLLHGGCWEEAADLATSVLGHPRTPPMARTLPLTALALIRARRGDPQVWPLLDEALSLGEPTAWTLGPVRAARAEAAWLDGDGVRAQAEARGGLDVATSHTDPWITGELARWIHIAGGRPLPVRCAQVFALELAGNWGASAQAWAQLGCGYDAALAQLAGDVPALAQALHTFESLGARPAAAITKARLRAQGARYGTRGPRPGTRANPHGLTTRQLEILELVRDGLTGPQIATRLHISPKTADHHVTAILAKLSVRSRAEAARKLEK